MTIEEEAQPNRGSAFLSCWPQVLAELKARGSMLAVTLLENARSPRVEGDVVVIRLACAAHESMFTRGEARQVIEDALLAVTGERYHVRADAGGAAADPAR
jgi:hypothetical protein